jgi:L-cysteine:1D-myo-inositol 2-amino-2-deoxy-alpha-D-glucopyranoside ligase
LALLSHHYAADWEWTEADLTGAQNRLQVWRAAVSRPDGPEAGPTLAALRAALAADLDGPAALGAVDEWAHLAGGAGGTDPGAPGVVSRAVDALLGIAL